MSEMDDIFRSMLGEEKKKSSFSLPEIMKLLKDYWSYLWEKKWVVIISGFSFALLGLIYAFVRTVEYTASYHFTIEGEESPMRISMASLLGTGSVGAFSGDNLVQLMRSQAMIERTLLREVPNHPDSINFIEYYLVCDSVRSACEELAEQGVEKDEDGPVSVCDIQFPLYQDRRTFTREQDSILMIVAGGMAKKMAVERLDKKMSFVTCSYTYKNEEFCKKFLDTYMDEVLTFYMETKMSRSEKNISNFQRQADSIKAEWNKAVVSRAYYADENMNAARQSVSVELQKKQMEIQTYSTAYVELMKSIATMKVDQMKETPVIQIISEPHYPLQNDKARKLKFIIIGGFLGGFFSVLALLAICYYNQSIKPLLNSLPATVEDKE
ncbi:MAG: hypothetical protein IK005_12010 [Paludibacteraceae bacterium]|nr:hypothetical protein [Paludibacteraceae bacterium]